MNMVYGILDSLNGLERNFLGMVVGIGMLIKSNQFEAAVELNKHAKIVVECLDRRMDVSHS